MSAVLTLVWLSVTGLVWVSAAIINARLVTLFRRTFPEEASESLPPPGVRDPILLTYFLKASSKNLLRRNRNIWKQRQALVMLLALSAVLPLVGFLAIAVLAHIADRGG